MLSLRNDSLGSAIVVRLILRCKDSCKFRILVDPSGKSNSLVEISRLVLPILMFEGCLELHLCVRRTVTTIRYHGVNLHILLRISMFK